MWVIRYQLVPELADPLQVAFHEPPVTVPYTFTSVPAVRVRFSVAVDFGAVRRLTPPHAASTVAAVIADLNRAVAP